MWIVSLSDGTIRSFFIGWEAVEFFFSNLGKGANLQVPSRKKVQKGA